LPCFTDGFVGGEGLESAAEIVCGDEVVEVLPELVVAVVIIALDRRLLDGAVHPFDLPVGPRVFHLGQAVLDPVLVADPVEDMVEGVFVVGVIGELDTVAHWEAPVREPLSP
jgi:hypothetical protein